MFLSTNGENLGPWWTFPEVSGLPELLQHGQLIQVVTEEPIIKSEEHLMGEFHGKKQCWPKRRQRFISHLPKKIFKMYETLGKILKVKVKSEAFGMVESHYIRHKSNKTFYHKNTATVKHRGDSSVVWGYLSSSGPEQLNNLTDGVMNSALCQKLLKEIIIFVSLCS